jgi:hypothetical protein
MLSAGVLPSLLLGAAETSMTMLHPSLCTLTSAIQAVLVYIICLLSLLERESRTKVFVAAYRTSLLVLCGAWCVWCGVCRVPTPPP